jgi:hypothetical protein
VIRPPIAWSAPLLGLALVCGCDHQRLAGGTTETDNMASARVMRVDSLLPSWNRPVAVATVATLRLDSSTFDFEASTDEGRDLVVETLDGLRLPFRIAFWDKGAARGRIQVRLEPDQLQPGARIRLRWGLADSDRTDSAAVWKAISDSQRLALTSVLVGDFEDSGLRSGLPNAGVWYSHAADSATISEPSIVDAGQGRPGKALRVAFSLPPTKGYAFVGVLLADGIRSLRSLDSIELWARGTQATLSVSLDHQSGTKVPKAWTSRSLDSTWRRFAIRPVDFDSGTGVGGNVGWIGVRDSVANLSLFAARAGEMWIDEVRLHGIDRADLE